MTEPPHYPCAACGRCCRSYVVPLSGHDVWTISTAQQLPPEHFVVALVQENPGRDGFLMEAGERLYGLALDKRGPLRPDRPCVFLLQLGGGNDRCGIYPQRPVVCRTYPMALIQHRIEVRADALCPTGAWSRDLMDLPGWRLHLNELDLRFDVYHEVVSRWNARVTLAPPDTRFTLSDFLAYLMNVYARLDLFEHNISEEDFRTVTATWRTAPENETGTRPAWIQYFIQVRGIIDTFFPEITSLPLRLMVQRA